MSVPLVLINVVAKTYMRYIGKTRHDIIKTEELLSPYWVEEFRVRPENVIPPEEPQLA